MTADQLPAVRTAVLTPDAAEAAGYARFNGGAHLAVDVPDGNFTITARMTNGKRVTFAFVPYRKDEPAGCVDISYDDAPVAPLMNGRTACHVMHAIGFTVGPDTFDTRKIAAPTTLITVLIANKHYAETEPDR